MPEAMLSRTARLVYSTQNVVPPRGEACLKPSVFLVLGTARLFQCDKPAETQPEPHRRAKGAANVSDPDHTSHLSYALGLQGGH
jgi:hypothetical protein